MDTGDWTALAAIATGLMAIATASLTWKTRSMASATENMAIATQALVLEAQLDRELSWSPFLACDIQQRRIDLSGEENQQGPSGYNETLSITNLGKGRAMNCVYLSVSRQQNRNYWCILRSEGLAGDSSIKTQLASPISLETDVPLNLLEPTLSDSISREFTNAMFCEDIFGNRLRFLVGHNRRELWRPDDKSAPPWAESSLIWEQ